MIVRCAVGLAVAALYPGVAALSQEKPIKQADLPAPVAKTVAVQSQGATVLGFSREREKGQTYYEVEMRVNGHTKDVLMDASGAVVEVEEEVAIDALPDAVRAGLKAGAGKGRITSVESLTKQGKLVAYEAHVVLAGKRSEVQVGPDGKPLEPEK